MEQPIFFNNRNNKKLFGILHLPDNAASKAGIVICQPIAEERHRTKRVFVNLARFLTAEGYSVLLFDYYGEGDSEGEFENADIQTRLLDIVSAIDFLREKTDAAGIGLLGLSLGATLAALIDSQSSKIDFKVLWHPVIKGNEYVQDWLKINLASQLTSFREIRFTRQKLIEIIQEDMFIEVEGFIFHKNLYTQLAELDLSVNFNDGHAETVVIELAERVTSTDKFIKKFIDSRKENNKALDYILLNKTFKWKSLKNFNPCPRELFDKTLDWISTRGK